MNDTKKPSSKTIIWLESKSSTIGNKAGHNRKGKWYFEKIKYVFFVD